MNLFEFTNLEQTFEDFRVPQLCIPQDSTPALNGFDDLVCHIARQTEPSGVGIDLHRPPKSLLGARGHAISQGQHLERVLRTSRGADLSASSRMMILCRPGGRVTFF